MTMRSSQSRVVQAQQDGSVARLYGPWAPQLVEGYIADVVAGQRFYKVDIPGAQLACRDLATDSGLNPMGPVKIHVYQVGSRVLVARDPTNRCHFIIGVSPFLVGSDKMNLVTPIAPFTGADAANDVPHYYPLKMAHAGGVYDYNSGRPLDAIPGSDVGVINELGVGYGAARLFSWLKSSEMSGIWFHYLDMLCRLAAYNFEFMHSGGARWIKNDEGEIDEYEWMSPYPWEAVGMLEASGTVLEEAEGGGYYKPGQFDNRYKLSTEGQIGIGRVFTWAGYLGDVHREIIAVPEEDKVPSTETQSNKSNYTGVLSLQKHMDGTYAVRSARQVLIEKYTVIPVPKQIAVPDDSAKQSDSPEDYKAAGMTGDGPDHTKKDWTFSEEESPATWLAQLQDYHSYMFNYYGFIPIIRHEKDWYLPEASKAGIGDASEPAIYVPDPPTEWAVPPPSTVTLKIDHRTESVKYYMSRSFFDLLPDGSVVIGDGYGSTITMSQGHIFMDAMADIYVKPGRNLVAWAGSDAVLKAGNSVDITAAVRDVRIKADRNLHVVAGNSGDGGMLLESRSEGDTFKFNNVVGQDVQSTGIVFKAVDSQILGYGKDIYLRSMDDGKLTLDAGGGRGERVDIGKSITRIGIQFIDTAGERLEDGKFTTDSVATNLFTQTQQILGADSTVHMQAHVVTMGRTDGNTELSVDGGLILGGGILMEGSLELNDNVICHQSMLAKRSVIARDMANVSGDVVELNDPPLADRSEVAARDALEGQAQQREDLEEQKIDGVIIPLQEQYYTDAEDWGHEEFIEQIGFSCRNADQYTVEGMLMPESLYQQLYRTKGQGVVYLEPEVEAPWGEKTRPWPGQDPWEKDKTYVFGAPSLFDPATGRAKDRTDEGYTNAKATPGVKAQVMKGNYRVTKQE